MKKTEPTNFRTLKKAILVTVLEGDGTPEDVFREVIYVYDKKGMRQIGIIDPRA